MGLYRYLASDGNVTTVSNNVILMFSEMFP